MGDGRAEVRVFLFQRGAVVQEKRPLAAADVELVPAFVLPELVFDDRGLERAQRIRLGRRRGFDEEVLPGVSLRLH